MSPPVDRLAAALGLGSDATSVLAKLDAFYSELDRHLAERSAGLALPCREGCDACCHESVFVSAPEFLAVVRELIATRSPQEIAQLIREMRAIAETYADELELLETIPAGAERNEVAARVHFRCPLLDTKGACTVYAARELNARTFGQSWDHDRREAYGCVLTVGRLRVIGQERSERLGDARAARKKLSETVPGTERVHVYPWWFDRYGDLILEQVGEKKG